MDTIDPPAAPYRRRRASRPRSSTSSPTPSARTRLSPSRIDWLAATILVTRDRAIDRWMEFDPRRLSDRLQAGLLPVGRVPDRPAPPRRHVQSRPGRADHRGAAGPWRLLRRDRGARARRRPRQWRPRPSRRLLHGKHGDGRHPRLRLWHPLCPRPLPPGDPGRQADRAARGLAIGRQPLGVRAARGGLRDRLRRQRRERRHAGRHGAPALAAAGEGLCRRLRHPDRRLARARGSTRSACGAPVPPTRSASTTSTAATTSGRWPT